MTESELKEQRQKWHQDETRWKWAFGLMVTVMVATTGHLVTGVFWAGSINERVAGVEARYERQRHNISALELSQNTDRIAAARQEQALEDALRILRDIETILRGGR
jgi:hypothetical protein